MSKRLSSRAASATRAACPPESEVIKASARRRGRGRRARRDAVVEVGGAAGHPTVERHGVGVVGSPPTGPQGSGCGLDRRGRLTRPGATSDVLRYGLAGHPLVLLGEEADEGVVWSAWTPSLPKARNARPNSESSVDRAVGADHADHATGATARLSSSNRARRPCRGQVLRGTREARPGEPSDVETVSGTVGHVWLGGSGSGEAREARSRSWRRSPTVPRGTAASRRAASQAAQVGGEQEHGVGRQGDRGDEPRRAGTDAARTVPRPGDELVRTAATRMNDFGLDNWTTNPCATRRSTRCRGSGPC